MPKPTTKPKTKSNLTPKSKCLADQEVQMDRRRAKDRRTLQEQVSTNLEPEVAVEKTQAAQTQKTKAHKVELKKSGESKPEMTASDAPKSFQPARRKQQRRRQIDPTTCEREYNQHEIEFMQAIDAYKRSAGRMFPTCSEVLEVIKSLGYVRLSKEEQAILQNIQDVEAELAQVGLEPCKQEPVASFQ